MDIPRFCHEHLNPKLCQQDIGCTFQEFVHEALLTDYPDLHLFPGLGKDGAIDLSQTMSASRTIVECKYIGKDSFDDILSIWKNVASKLEKHLADPSGPTKGQAQYMPWYRVDLPIREYIFCVSSTISNQNQIDQLNIMIVEFFRNLSIKHEHLNHLKGLSVEVLDWNACCSLIKKRPHLIFRWFPKTRIPGFVPLYDSHDTGTFHSYLNSEKLTYYSRSQHLKVMSAPQGVDIPDEENLLNILEKGDTTGLIVTGGGGVGKTRLMLEMGRLAQNKNWLVFRVQNQLKDNSLEQLTHQINPETSVLLLIDYIETQKEFYDIVETLNGINDTYFLHLRYIACCRTSYYQTISATSRHIRVDLSPPVQDSAVNWYENYQKQTVVHILKEGGLEVSDSHLDICRKKPIFAVLISYLYCSGHQPDLAELLKEKDFGKWVTKKLQLSFGQTDIGRDLALLIALFPLQSEKVSLLDPKKQGVLFDKLATDDWIEEQPADEFQNIDMWFIAHDVLADQILLSYFGTIPHTYERFIDELFSQAKSMGCLRSAIITLQRLQPELGSLHWSKILLKNISEDIIAWRNVRDILIRTSLLSPIEIISMLGEQEELWEGAEFESDFHNAIGWLTRWTINQKEPLDAINRSILDLWIGKVSSYPTSSNFILTCGLRFSPEAVREPALRWIQMYPVLFQTHYLMVAWMECHLPLTDIASPVLLWIDRFRYEFHLSFVVKAWLEAGGDKELVKEHIKTWLVKHGDNPEARFIFRSWLDSGGDKELVKEHIKTWLVKHGDNPEARFIFRSWLDSGGDKELVKEHIKTWLVKHGDILEAGFIFQSWLDSGGDKELVKEHIKTWLVKHGDIPEAGFIFQSWHDSGGDKELVKEHIKTWLVKHGDIPEAGFIFQSWLDSGGDKELVKEHIKTWFEKHGDNPEARFIFRSWLDSGGDKELVKEHIKPWLVKHGDIPEAGFIFQSWLDSGGDNELVKEHIKPWLEKYGNNPEASFVFKAWLDSGGDKELVKKHIKTWFEKHGDNPEADFIYKAWLEAGGEFSIIKSPAIFWMQKNYDRLEAVYLSKCLAKEKDIPIETVKDILKWCQKFPKNEDAIWRMTHLNGHLVQEEIGEEVISTSEMVLSSLILSKKPLRPMIRNQITILFSYLISAPKLSSYQLKNRADKLLIAWIRYPTSFGGDLFPNISIQQLFYVERVVNLLDSGLLDLDTDRSSIERFLYWVNNWKPERKKQLHLIFNILKSKYDLQGLWDIVEIK